MSTKKKNLNAPGHACPSCGTDAAGAAFCPDCGTKLRGASTDEKRARLEQGGGGKGKGLIVGVAAALLVAAGAVFALRGGGVQRAESVAATSATAPGGGVTLPVSTFDDRKAHYFQWNAPSGTTVRFFGLKSADGVVRVAFDACDVCYPAKKGYAQEGDYMVCRNCGQRFESVRINEVRGGCNPSPVDRTVEGGTLVITAAALAAGEKYF